MDWSSFFLGVAATYAVSILIGIAIGKHLKVMSE
jgi:hypothetical protein